MTSQICVKCRKLKPAHLGKRIKSSTRYSTHYFICDHCAASPLPPRNNRACHESPIERKVRESLASCGQKVLAEYPLGKFYFDFAVPALRLLIEVDSAFYHRLPRQKKRDRFKDELARLTGWKVARIGTERAELDALQAVLDRKNELC